MSGTTEDNSNSLANADQLSGTRASRVTASNSAPRSILRVTVGWVLTPVYLSVFICTVLVWHPLIVGAFYFGSRTYHWVIAVGNGALVQGLSLMAARVTARGFRELPRNRPLIVVSNHQSLYDIPLLLWNLRHVTPCFIAKKELGRGIPSASHSLRNMGSVLIDRSNTRAAVSAISDFGTRMNSLRRAAVIFPEGTRARDGRMKRFKPQGLQALCAAMPDALIVPVVISGSWKLTQWNLRPVFPGAHIQIRALAPVPLDSMPPEATAERLDQLIRSHLPPEEAQPPELTRSRRNQTVQT